MSHSEDPQPHVVANGVTPGSIVRCRNRDWVLLPSDSPDVHLLRPLTGATDEVIAVHKQLTNLIGYDLPEERVRSATFPLPSLEDLADAASAHLLWQAARLTLREGATPFRSLGRISIRPRIYQFVPLLMALRLDPVRLLIADDVGVGKTIEALLVARELYDRGEIRRLCVLCPPYLCEQWQQELEELAHAPSRVLVATDCLSEGINLQQAFTAALHYDLPWNPNRLEQREGRVDRYGQTAPLVKAVRYFSPDSAVDGIVLDVLLNKAREIHRTLGTYMPVPEESESVTEAVLNALFLRGRKISENQLQLDFGFEAPQVASLHARWEQDAERERINRTRFARRALKPEEVRRELEATDAVLGDPDAVRTFVLNAAQRLGLAITRDKRPDVYRAWRRTRSYRNTSIVLNTSGASSPTA